MLRRVMQGLQAMLVAEGARMVSKGLIVVLLANKFLTPDEYGLLFLSLSILGTGLLFSYLGFAKSAARYITEYRSTDPGQIPYIVTTSLRYNLVSIAVVSLTFVLASDVIATIVREPSVQPFLVVGALYIATMTLSKFATIVFQGFNRVRWSACIGALSNVSLLVFTVAFLLAGLGAVGALAGYVLGYGLAAFVGLGVIYTRFLPQYTAAASRDPELSGKILRYSIPLTITRGGHTLDKNVDTILVGFFLTPTAVAYYVLAKQIADFVTVPATSLGFAVSPAYGEQKASDSLASAGTLYEHAFIHTLLLYLPAGVGLVLVARPLVTYVFGAAYLGAVPVVQVFGCYILLRSIDKITNDGLDFVGRARERAVAKTSASVGNVLLNVALIPVIGVVGAAISTVVTYTALIGVELYIIDQEFPIDRWLLVRSLAAIGVVTAGMAVVVVVGLPLVTGLVSLLTLVGGAVGVWAMLAVGVGLIDTELVNTALENVLD